MKFLLNGPRLLALFAVSISAIIFYQAYNSYSQVHNLLNHGTTVKATVTDVIHQQGKYPGTIYRAYFAVKEGHFVATNNFITDDTRYQVGDSVDVIYNADNPDNSIINDSYEHTTWILYATIGFVILGVATSLLIYIRPGQPE